jgi:hypothetical protein
MRGLKTMNGWIGVDLDGTLAQYDGWIGVSHIGDPVPAMLTRVLRWLEQGYDVRIFTARVSRPEQEQDARARIELWCETHIGQVLPITNEKDTKMIELWDDRAVQVIANTGQPVGKSNNGLC